MRCLALAALLVALAATAQSASGTGGWGAAANRVCARDFAAAHAYEKRVGATESKAQALEILRLEIAAITRARVDLARIPRPAARATRIAELLRELDLLLTDVKGMQRALRAGDTARLTVWGRASAVHANQANADSRALGAAVCAGA